MSALEPTKKRLFFEGVSPDGQAYENEDFSGSQFIDFGAKSCKFRKCRFDHCTFLRAYFRNADFEDCSFIGSKFRDSTFRGAVFRDGAVFNYSTFRASIMPPAEMLRNQPSEPNLKLKYARSLRQNFSELGMHDEARKFFLVELSAEYDHYCRAVSGSEPYYSNKYPTLAKRLPFYWKRFAHRSEELVWGHGVKPYRLAISTAVGILALTLSFIIIGEGYGGEAFLSSPATAIGDALYYTLLNFFSATHTFATGTPLAKLLTVLTQLYGYLTLGLFVAVVYRRLSRF